MPPPTVADDKLVTSAQRGDVSAFNGLVERYQTLAYNVALRTLGHPEAAADATQDAFLAAFRAVGSFHGGSFKAWLLRIVTNACYDQGRRSARRPSTSLDAILEEGASEELPDPGPLPEGVALRVELASELQELLLRLPFDQRAVVVLSDLHGLSYEEVAEAVSTSLGTVKSRLSRGRARLRDLIASERPELLAARERS